MRQKLIVRPLARRCHACGEQGPGPDELAGPLCLLQLRHERLRIAAGGENGAETVVRVTLEVVDQILAPIVFGAPGLGALETEVGVPVDQGGNHRFSREVDDFEVSPGRLGAWADGADAPLLDQDRGLIEHAAVADDDARVFEQYGLCDRAWCCRCN